MVDISSSPAAPFVAGAQSDQLRLPLRSSHERREKEVKASGSGLSPQRQLPLQIYPCGDEFASDIATSSGMPITWYRFWDAVGYAQWECWNFVCF